MKERARELKAEMRRGPRTKKSDGEKDVLAKIAEMPNRIPPWPNGSMPSSKSARQPSRRGPITGMSAYAKDGNVVCFFQSAEKFNTRYATFGFSDKANLDEGALWPVAFALKKLTATEEARISALVKKAVS